METRSRGTVVMAVYDDPEQAKRAVEELRRFDFRDEEIGLAVYGEVAQSGTARRPAETNATVPRPAAGALLGGVLGAVAAGAIPALGAVLAGGILGAVLEGATAGGLLGALLDLGVPEPQAHSYVQAVEPGRAIVVVVAGERADEADDILQAYGPYKVELAADTRLSATD
jgi:uncharacterized membrane protein